MNSPKRTGWQRCAGRVRSASPCRIPGAFLLLVLVLAAARPARAQQDAWYAALGRFADRLERDVAADGVGGLSAGVVVGDSVVWARGFGWADAERRRAATVHTIYRTGSISKSFTAVAMMRLVEDSVLALDDPVARSLPEVERLADRRPEHPPITFRQLASHTAGLIREPELEGAASGPIEGWEYRILASIPTTRFQAEPGTEYSYSNIGFGVLGLALSRAAGKPFTSVVREEIIEPLGMESTTFVITPRLSPRLAKGYANRGDGAPDTLRPEHEHRGRGYKVPNGGVYSTVHDLARFIAAMTGAARPAILRAESRGEMQRVQTPEDGGGGYGLGFAISETDAGRLVGHGGSVAGYNAYILFHPESRIGVVLLRNYNQGTAGLGAYARELLPRLIEVRAERLSRADPCGSP